MFVGGWNGSLHTYSYEYVHPCHTESVYFYVLISFLRSGLSDFFFAVFISRILHFKWEMSANNSFSVYFYFVCCC